MQIQPQHSQLKAHQCLLGAFKIKAEASHPRLELLQQRPSCSQLHQPLIWTSDNVLLLGKPHQTVHKYLELNMTRLNLSPQPYPPQTALIPWFSKRFPPSSQPRPPPSGQVKTCNLTLWPPTPHSSLSPSAQLPSLHFPQPHSLSRDPPTHNWPTSSPQQCQLLLEIKATISEV